MIGVLAWAGEVVLTAGVCAGFFAAGYRFGDVG